MAEIEKLGLIQILLYGLQMLILIQKYKFQNTLKFGKSLVVKDRKSVNIF